MSTLGEAADVNPESSSCHTRSTCVAETLSVSPSVDMLPFGVTIPATVPQRWEIQMGLVIYPVFPLFVNKFPVVIKSVFLLFYLKPLVNKTITERYEGS